MVLRLTRASVKWPPPRKPVNCWIGLGSNLGRTEHPNVLGSVRPKPTTSGSLGRKTAQLRFALRELGKLPNTRLMRHSSFYTSRPVGVKNQPDYLNAVAWIRSALSPMGLLVHLKRLEALRGRRPGRRWAARPLDLDILFYGKLKLRTPFLRIPHPRALKRDFVRIPLAELGYPQA